MSERTPRLGDVIDDYCSRCRLILNHGVMGLVDDAVKRVRCNTCMHEHDYRQGKVPRRRKDKQKELFDEVLARIPSGAAGTETPEKPKPAPEPARPSPDFAFRRSLHKGVSERMAELRAKAEAEHEARREEAQKQRVGKRRRRRGRRGRGGGNDSGSS